MADISGYLLAILRIINSKLLKLKFVVIVAYYNYLVYIEKYPI